MKIEEGVTTGRGEKSKSIKSKLTIFRVSLTKRSYYERELDSGQERAREGQSLRPRVKTFPKGTTL